MRKIVGLCSNCNNCPVVEIDDNCVKVGEAGNLCILKVEEWEALRRKIIDGEL
ncbi:hypothetical protein HY639_00120 [Candidatus Woesearchaeota archaeon]|nr:hypothetical protein [Candidatus Woesearchaeota archaeon]